MDQLVVDSSVVVKWFVAEVLTTEARKIYSEYQSGNVRLLAPDLIYAEVGNITWRKQMYEGMSAQDAQLVLADFQAVGIEVTSAADLLPDAYQIAIAHGRSIYDSLYIALSLREQCQFVTADNKLVNAVRAVYSNIVSLAHWS